MPITPRIKGGRVNHITSLGKRRLAFSTIALLSAVQVSAQSSSPAEVHQLAIKTVARYIAMESEVEHYAYTDTFQSATYDDHGKRTSQHEEIVEFVVLNGVPYERYAKIDGKQLSPAELSVRNENIDAKRTRRLTLKKSQKTARVTLYSDLLTNKFEPSVSGHESIDGHDCIVLIFNPTSEVIEPYDKMSHTFWIDSITGEVFRYAWQHLADYDTGPLDSGKLSDIISLRGARSITSFHVVDGVSLPYQTVTDRNARSKTSSDQQHYHSVDTETNYERFKTSVTISPTTPTK